MSVDDQVEHGEALEFDFVVVGGGLAGICAAIAAARGGALTALVQNRPVLGGNSSSEVRVPPASVGLHVPWAVETGILYEIILEDRWRNPGRFWPGYINSMWDLVLYEWVTREPELSLFLNTSVRQVRVNDDGSVDSVVGMQLGSERVFRFRAPLFCDATGDGTVACMAGAGSRCGREARSEFGEPGAPEEADAEVLPSSLLMRARDVGKPVPFRAPPWAVKYPDEKVLGRRSHYDPENDMYLWLEIGSPFDTLRDNEAIRVEILKYALGVWDHVKNYCTKKEQAADWALEWVGMVVGKRETRRIQGDYWLREQDVTGAARFADTVAYGSWFVDHHNPLGMKAGPDEPWIADDDLRKVMVQPYGIPYRCLYAKAVPNLFLAGRCISVTHMALGSVRLQPTLACCGQAVGTAAALCLKRGLQLREFGQQCIGELQQQLIRDDCFLPGVKVEDPGDLAQHATIRATSSDRLRLEPGESEHELTVGLAQLFPVSASRIETVSLPLRSVHDKPVEVHLGLRAASNCWDLDMLDDAAIASAVMPANGHGYVTFRLDSEVKPRSFYWVYVQAQPGVFWKDASDVPTGCVAAWEVEFKPQYYLHSKVRFARAMRLAPESQPFGPQNVIASPGRPESWTNCWVSDPEGGFPQRLTLEWSTPVRFSTVRLLCDSNLNREFRYITPLSAPTELVQDYELQAWLEGGWQTVLHERKNRARRCVHSFAAVVSRRLRIVVHATRGDPSARIYGVRVYDET